MLMMIPLHCGASNDESTRQSHGQLQSVNQAEPRPTAISQSGRSPATNQPNQPEPRPISRVAKQPGPRSHSQSANEHGPRPISQSARPTEPQSISQ